MPRKLLTIPIAPCLLLAFTFLVQSGCQPAEKKAAETAQATNTAPATNSASDTAVAISEPNVVITNENDSTEENDSANENDPKTNTDASSDSPAVEETGSVENKSVESETSPRTIDGELSKVDWSSLIGQQVVVPGDLVVVDTYDMARRGQVVVARDRLYVPTSKIDPNDADPNEISFEGGSNVAKVVGAQKLNDRATITLDDGSSKQNIFPPVIFPTLGKSQPTLRVGSTVSGVSGTLTKERNKIVLVPNKPLDWEPAPRPKRPEVGDADVTVASFNVLNYFTTIDNGSNNARGADSKSEFDRQERKLVAAIIELQADVVGLMELENNLESESRLVAALNKKVGSEVFKGCGLPEGFDSAPGGKNAIRVGIIYRSDRIKAIGDVSMIRDDAFDGARTPLVQSFQSGNSGKPFSVVVNHFKSKGGSSRAGSADKNKGDGQGAYNATRRSQSLAICNFIAKQKPTEGSPRVLVIGDLNAYGEEDPIDAMRANGLADLQQRSSEDFDSGNTERHYSYIYRGQSGSLDHAMATDALAADVTGVATWHINADEPRFLDYNEEYKPKSLYKPDPFRSSDHDPVLIGIKN